MIELTKENKGDIHLHILSRTSIIVANYLAEKRITQVEFSERTGVSQSSICHLLQKQRLPKITSLLLIAQEVGVDFLTLLGIVSPQTTTQVEPVVKTEACPVVRVVDGDTLIVRYQDEDVRVRLIGIDTPESVHPDKSKNTEDGLAASNYVKELLAEKSVYLEFDKQQQDFYKRYLAYVYLEDGTFLNAHLLEKGMAIVATYPPNKKYVELFESIVERGFDERGENLS